MSFLRVDNINKSFSNNKVLTDVSLEFEKGEIHSIIGENGAGKSTLMKIIGGIYQADSGTVSLDGKILNINNPLQAYEVGIGIVHQELSVVGNMSVAQNIFVNCEPTRFCGFVNWDKINDDTKVSLAKVGAQFVDPAVPVNTLSVGIQQLVEIAKVLSKDVRVLILDEPTSSLSDKEIEKLFCVLFSLKARGVSIIFISHKLNEVIKISDKVSVLRDGHCTGTLDRKMISEDVIIRLMVGRDLGRLYPCRSSFAEEDRSVIFSVENITRKKKFNNISFSLRKGEVLGLFGLIGSGRTECALSLFGADKVDSGKICFEGREISFRSPQQAVSNGICYLSEDRKASGLFVDMSVRENIVAACLENISNRIGFLNAHKSIELTEDYIKKLSIHPEGCSSFRIRNLSGGNQQKVLFSKWLATKPKVLIVDEPTRGVDVGAKVMIHSILRSLAESGMAILMISSELPEILGVSDRVLVMHEGKEKALFLVNESLTEEKIMNAVFG